MIGLPPLMGKRDGLGVHAQMAGGPAPVPLNRSRQESPLCLHALMWSPS